MREPFPFVETLAAAARGDEAALAVLYRDSHPRLLRYFFAMEPRDAEDLASETWLEMARGLRRFKGEHQRFRAWAFTIARRRVMDLRRRRAKKPSRRRDMIAQEPPEFVIGVDVVELPVSEAIQSVAALPPEQAEVMLLTVLGGLGAEEVGRIIGKRPGTVRHLQHRGLQNLSIDLALEAMAE